MRSLSICEPIYIWVTIPVTSSRKSLEVYCCECGSKRYRSVFGCINPSLQYKLRNNNGNFTESELPPNNLGITSCPTALSRN